MKSKFLFGLLVLNAVLLLLLVSSWARSGTAQAQLQMTHRPADYLMIPGEVNGGPTALVYIIDCSNNRLGAMAYDDSSRSLITMPSLNLDTIYKAARGVAR